MKLEFSLQFFQKEKENPQISNFTKMPPVGPLGFQPDGQTNGHTDRQTVMTIITVTFLNFANASANICSRNSQFIFSLNRPCCNVLT